ncbi:MAG: glucosamine-6-phosphate deaminase [Acidobacteriota bacterium]
MTLPDAGAVARAAADVLAGEAAARPDLALGLPTGRTMIPFYAELRERFGRGALDLSRARAFNLDELVLPRDHPAAFCAYMERHAWERVGLDRSRCAIPDGAAADPGAECARYDLEIAAAGGLDLAILGVGADGHVAYNLPGPPVERVHLVELPDALAEVLDVPGAWRPLRAITMGLGAIRAARRTLVLATSAEKAEAVRAMVAGPASDRWPCSLLAGHPRLDVILSAEAAAGLS